MARPEFKLRCCFARDLKRLAKIDADLCDVGTDPWLFPWDEDHFMRACGPVKDGRFTSVAVDDTDVPQGYVCWRLALDWNPARVRQRVAELVRLGVDRSVRGRGLGRRLVEDVKRVAFGQRHEAEAMIAGVPERHRYLCEFFRHLGWPCELVRRPDEPEDIIKFRLHLALARLLAEGRTV